jgi:hypothetical protein
MQPCDRPSPQRISRGCKGRTRTHTRTLEDELGAEDDDDNEDAVGADREEANAEASDPEVDSPEENDEDGAEEERDTSRASMVTEYGLYSVVECVMEWFQNGTGRIVLLEGVGVGEGEEGGVQWV